MAHLSMVSASTAGTADPSIRRISDTPPTNARSDTRARDVAEISHGAIEASRAEASPAPIRAELVRAELVNRIREQIASGTYLTDDKLDVVADRLSRRLHRTA